MISGIIKVEVTVISRSRRLRLITLTETMYNNPNYDDDILSDSSRKSLLNLVNASWLFEPDQSVD